MHISANKTHANKTHSDDNVASKKQSAFDGSSQFTDNRPEAITQRKLQDKANKSLRTKQTAQLRVIANNYSATLQQPHLESHFDEVIQLNKQGVKDKWKSKGRAPGLYADWIFFKELVNEGDIVLTTEEAAILYGIAEKNILWTNSKTVKRWKKILKSIGKKGGQLTTLTYGNGAGEKWARANPLTVNGAMGTAPAKDNEFGMKPGEPGLRMDQLKKKHSNTVWVWAHLINHRLHGPGNNINNVVAFPSGANKKMASKHEGNIQKAVFGGAKMDMQTTATFVSGTGDETMDGFVADKIEIDCDIWEENEEDFVPFEDGSGSTNRLEK